MVALFCGNTKPSPLQLYLDSLVVELTNLLNEGIYYRGTHYTIKVHSFVCDAPARAFIKSHGGYSACDKCIESGQYVKGRVIYKSVNATRRTDETFRLRLDEDNHVGVSPLLNLPVGLVSSFPIDYMHSVCLGVMKKLLNCWVGGDLRVRLPNRLVKAISDKITYCATYIPVEFNRRPSSLVELPRWKATEFRMFLLYLGPMVLKDALPIALFENYLLFHCSITILCSERYAGNETAINLANKLMIMFIKHSGSIYGTHFLIYNVHLLCHLADDFRTFGALDSF